jgi:nucleoside-diphosphate-sugar epimerase
LVNNFIFNAIKKKKLFLFEENFRRNFIHIDDVIDAIIFSIINFKKLKNNIFNLGLSSANITKQELAKKIKKEIKDLKILKSKNKKDPDKRDYFVSNKKIEKAGFKAKISLENGIKELVQVFQTENQSYKNNY